MPILGCPAFNVTSDSLDVIQCLNEIIEKVLRTDDLSDDFCVIDRTGYRLGDAETESVISERVIILDSDDDSEEEFNRILEMGRKICQRRTVVDDGEEEGFTVFTDRGFIEHEYDKLPAVEQLSVSVNESVKLQRLGKVVEIVDCLVVIQCDSNIALDFDSILFDENGKAIGQVYDIFGAVRNPFYAIRFNSLKDASEHPVGKFIFYAPAVEEFTHTIFTEQLKNLKITDAAWDGEGECPDECLAFSDDEAEKRYIANKKQNREERCRGQNEASTSKDFHQESKEGERRRRYPRSKRGRFSNVPQRPLDYCGPAAGPSSFAPTENVQQVPQYSQNRYARPSCRNYGQHPEFRPPYSSRGHHPRFLRNENNFAFGGKPNFRTTWVGVGVPPTRPSPEASFPICNPVLPHTPISREGSNVCETNLVFVDTRLVENENS